MLLLWLEMWVVDWSHAKSVLVLLLHVGGHIRHGLPSRGRELTLLPPSIASHHSQCPSVLWIEPIWHGNGLEVERAVPCPLWGSGSEVVGEVVEEAWRRLGYSLCKGWLVASAIPIVVQRLPVPGLFALLVVEHLPRMAADGGGVMMGSRMVVGDGGRVGD